VNCPNCRWEAVEVVDVGTASGRKTYRCPKCRVKWREKNAAAVALGSLGGKARAAALSPEERQTQAADASIARWDGEKTKDSPLVEGARGMLSGKHFGLGAKKG